MQPDMNIIKTMNTFQSWGFTISFFPLFYAQRIILRPNGKFVFVLFLILIPNLLKTVYYLKVGKPELTQKRNLKIVLIAGRFKKNGFQI